MSRCKFSSQACGPRRVVSSSLILQTLIGEEIIAEILLIPKLLDSCSQILESNIQEGPRRYEHDCVQNTQHHTKLATLQSRGGGPKLLKHERTKNALDSPYCIFRFFCD